MLRIILGVVAVLVVLGGGVIFFSNPSPPIPGVADESRISEPPIPEVPIPAAQSEKPAGVAGISVPTTQSSGNTTISPAPMVCSGSHFDQFQCYRTYYPELIKKQGVKTAMADLRSRYNDPFVHSQCHQLVHIVGRAAAEQYPTVVAAFRVGDPFCWSGYYHGVMESAVAGVPRATLASALDTFCQEIPGKEKYSFDYYNCVHGLGHGIMSILANELFDSLDFCNNLSGGWERSSCWSGAFMENIIADEVNHFSKYLKADDPLYPCNAVAGQYRATCYLMQTSRMLALANHDFAKVFELCSRVEESYQNVCYQSLGRDASGKSVSNVERTRATCLLGRDYRQQSNCVIGAAKDFISYYHSDQEARQLCASLPAELHEVCYRTVDGYYKLF